MPAITRRDLEKFKRVTVMGIGLFGGGGGAARYFAERGARVVATDLADAKKLAPSLAALADLDMEFVLGEHREEDFVKADLVIANQAVRPENALLAKARAAGVPVLTETGLALSLNASPWAGVTGSSGKSTVSALAAAMLQEHDKETLFGGNIGGSLLTRVEGRPKNSPLLVELSSFQLLHLAGDFAAGRIAPPRAAAITNISPNHLDWHLDMDEYVAAKVNLLRFLDADGRAVLSADDPALRRAAAETRAAITWCALADPGGPDACFVREGAILLRLDGEIVLRLSLEKFRLMGRHNIHNALQSTALAHAMCRDDEAIARGFSVFPGLPHRLERLGEVAGRLFVNDSKATTPEAAILALEALDAPKVLIAGGYDKRSPFETLGAAIQERAAGLVLLGAAAPRLLAATAAAASRRPAESGRLPIVDAGDDFAMAVESAFGMTPPGGVVLLSPACASYGMFVNYEERGRKFGELMKQLGDRC